MGKNFISGSGDGPCKQRCLGKEHEKKKAEDPARSIPRLHHGPRKEQTDSSEKRESEVTRRTATLGRMEASREIYIHVQYSSVFQCVYSWCHVVHIIL